MSYSKHGNSSYQVFHKNASFRNTTDFNRDWRNNRTYSRRNLNAPSARNNRRLIALAVSVLLILICVIVIIVLFSKNSDTPGGEEIECPPGFMENGCQSSNFIGSLVWSDSKLYKLVDEEYYNHGIAFRVYAPGAEGVSVLTKMPEEEERSSAMEYFALCYFHLLEDRRVVIGFLTLAELVMAVNLLTKCVVMANRPFTSFRMENSCNFYYIYILSRTCFFTNI